jgi:transposase
VTVIGIDAHKKTHTCVAVDRGGAKVAEKTVAATSIGHAQALRWVRKRFGTEVTWGVEDVRSLTGLLERETVSGGSEGGEGAAAFDGPQPWIGAGVGEI